MKKNDKKSRFSIQGAARSKSDATESETTEETLREKEIFIRHVIELSPVVLVIYDLATEHHTYFSNDAVNVYGYTGDEMAQMQDPFAALLQPEDIPRIQENVNKLKRLGDGEINEFECLIRRGDGERRWINARSMIFARDAKGEARQVISATFDITERKEAEEKLIESEQRFRSYFELGLIGMAITSPTKGCLAVNDELCKILGYERDELLEKNWTEMTHPEDLAEDVAKFNRVMAGEIDGYRLDKRYIRKDNRIIDTTISVKCVRSYDGSVDYFVALLEDITKRKRAEEALRESEAKYRTLFDSIDEGFCLIEMIYDSQGVPVDYRFLETNRAFEAWGIAGATGKTALELVPDVEKRWIETYGRVAETGESVRVEDNVAAMNQWFDIYASRVGGSGSRKVAVVVNDTTKRKQAEKNLRESEENYRGIVNQAVAGIFKLDLDGNVTFSNQRFCEMLDYTREELLEMSAKQIVYAEDVPRNNWLFERLKNQGLSYEIEKRLVRKDGSLIWVNNQVSPVFDGAGNPESVIVVSVDITERKQAEEALRQSEEKFRILSDTGPALIWFVGPAGNVVYVNQHYLNFTGKSWNEIAGTGWQVVPHPDDAEEYISDFLSAQRDHRAFHRSVRVQRHDGKWRWIESFGKPLFAEDGTYLGHVGVSPDITEGKEAEELLRQSEERYRTLFNSIGEGFVLGEVILGNNDEPIDFRYLEANPAFNKIIGATENIIGKTAREVVPELEEEWYELTRRVGFDGETIRVEERVETLDKWVDAYFSPVEEKGSGKLVIVFADTTERKKAEESLRRAKEELEARVDERTAKLTELNTRLQTEISDRRRIEEERIELLRRIITVQEDERGRIARDLHDEMGQYLSALILGLDSLKNPTSKIPVPVNAQIERLEKLARKIDGEVNRLTFELRPLVLDDLGLVAALRQHAENWSQISGVEIAYSSTGLEDTRLAAEVEIALYRVVQEALTNVAKHAAASHVSLILQHKSNQHVTVIIEDNGIGFDDEDINQGNSRRRFGLAGMRTRLSQVGGTFEIESAKGKGTTIFARVPILLTNAQFPANEVER